MQCPNCEREVCECGPYVLDFRTWTFHRKSVLQQTKALRVNIIGDGSAGQRHARMLRERGCLCTVIGLGQEHPSCDAVVIASPPSTHEEYIRLYWARCPILCEGPVTAWLYKDGSTPPYPHTTAENWLFVPEVQQLIKKCNRPFSHKPVHAHLYFDYDLERWRGPGWPYKDSCYYESGIDNINVHELMVALALFGPAAEVCVHRAHTGKSKACDALTLSMRHRSGMLTTINSSWHSSIYRRGIQVYYEDGSFDEVGWASPQDDAICNKSYADMLDHWLDCIRTGQQPVPSLYDGFRAYKLLQGECL